MTSECTCVYIEIMGELCWIVVDYMLVYSILWMLHGLIIGLYMNKKIYINRRKTYVYILLN